MQNQIININAEVIISKCTYINTYSIDFLGYPSYDIHIHENCIYIYSPRLVSLFEETLGHVLAISYCYQASEVMNT